MRAKLLYQAGKLKEAIEALNAELRDNPGDVQRRTFLFELLCFAGNYDRAEKQLEIMTSADPKREMGTLLYRSALHAERERQKMFAEGALPASTVSTEVPGTINGKAFQEIEDGDTRIGGRLEVFAAGSYMWIPFAQIASVTMEPPKRLRDLIWIPAVVHPRETFQGAELGEVLLPVVTPLAWKHADDNVKLGRTTVWEELAEEGAAPAGQKVLLADGEDIPLLDLRELVFNTES